MKRVREYVVARPLALFAPALILGVVFSAHLGADRSWNLAALVVGVVAIANALLSRRGVAPAVVVFGVAIGFARHEWAEHVPPSDVAFATLPEERVRVRGFVLGRPAFFQENKSALEEVEERHEERASGWFALEIESIEEMPGVTGRLRVQFYDRSVSLIGGEKMALVGRLRHLRPRSNPGGVDRRALLAREGIGAILVVGEKEEGSVLSPAPNMSVRTTVESMRDALRAAFYRHARPDAAALLSALVIGSRENLPRDLVSSLQRSGTAHFLAISGQNLAIVLMLLSVALTVLGARGRRLYVTLIVLLFVYTALSGWQVSVVRAFLMASLWLGAHIVWRRADSVNAMCAASILILLVDPGQLFQVGFQLSFAAVLGILFIAPIFHEFVGRLTSDRWWGRLYRATRGTLAISMAAWLATAPIVLASFNLITPVILVANLALVPLILFETGAGIVVLVLALVAPPVASGVGWMAGLTLDGIAGISTYLTRIPGAYFYSPSLPLWGIALYYGALILWTAWVRLRPGGGRPGLCAVFALALAGPAFARQRPEGVLLVSTLDVGRGSAHYVEWPDGRNLVFDCGSLTHRDAGATVMAPYLWSRGVREVDTLVLSHADADHTNGARSLVERMRIRRLVVTRWIPAAMVEEFRALGLEVIVIERRGREPVPLAPGIEVLAPPTWEKYGAGVASNEASIVMRIEGRVLLTGDIEERGVRELLELGEALKSEVLVVPHHGKRHTLHEELARVVAPRVAVVSAPEGYYAPEVVGSLEKVACVYRTGRDGCIEVMLRSVGTDVRTFLSPME